MNRYAVKLKKMCEFGDSIAELATDPRIRVGSVVFPVDCSELWMGYNGVPSGVDHGSIPSALEGMGTGVSGAVHAEANALMKAGHRVRNPYEPCLLYCTLAPCPSCAAMVANSLGIAGVVVGSIRSDVNSGVPKLMEAGIRVVPRWALEVFSGSAIASLNCSMRFSADDREGELKAVEKVVSWWASMRPTRPSMPR